jgi:L-alanine-DL-glutamate epimerase-like enolase superfamily enzyme
VAHLVEAFHARVAPHFYKEIDIHLVSSIRNGIFLEYFAWLDGLLVNPLEVIGGRAKAPERPGLSLEFKPEAIKEYRV